MPSTTRTLDCKHLSPVWWFSQAVAYQKPVGASNTCEETDALKRRHSGCKTDGSRLNHTA